MTKIWIFIKKERRKKDRISLYGNLRQLSKDEVIKINDRVKNENAVRYMFKDTDYYEDNNYRIEKLGIIKSTRLK